MSTSRIPPGLLYFTIYNPTLCPADPDDHNEDAHEQAHILFYTAKERAVSRDRILRQVGLAKALVNFAEMFNPNDPCNNVHSQTRRMIMISPEPNFWIHAAIELAKFPRPPPPKGRPKPKSVENGSERDPGPHFDYEDNPALDVALKTDIMRGYDLFKLRHGSFTSILSRLGQAALELQLERFFTVWAWSWNLEGGHDFADQLGVPLHPAHPSLKPVLDTFTSNLPANVHPIVLSPPYAIPSTRFTSEKYPSSLARHLISVIPLEPSPESHLQASVETIKGKSPSDSSAKGNNPGHNTFLGVPIAKWNWLSFGKNGSSSSAGAPTSTEEKRDVSTDDRVNTSINEVEVDTSALEDAISSDSASIHTSPRFEESRENGNLVDGTHTAAVAEGLPDADKPEFIENDNISHEDPTGEDASAEEPDDAISTSNTPVPDFIPYTIHLAPADDPVATTPQKCFYFIQNQFMLALLGVEVGDDHSPIEGQLDSAIEKSLSLFDQIETVIRDEEVKRTSESLPSASKILQTRDRHIISTDTFSISTDRFSSKSTHLYHAEALENTNLDISEVFSRGQNPQHWHVAKRGLGSADDDDERRVYLEVFRKETSLTDVDNVLTGIFRRSGLQDGFS